MSIVVGYIPTLEGRAALERAITEARTARARLIVVNSSPGNAYTDPRFVQEEEAESLHRKLEESKIDYRILQPLRGHDAAEDVIQAAEEHQADLVVIGLRKRSAVGKLLLGSTAQRILLQAHCAVLAVKAD